MTLPAGATLACLLCAAQGPGHTGHRQQDGQQGQQGQGHPVWALHRGQGGHLQCHTGENWAECGANSHPIQALEDLIMVSYTGPGDRLFQGVLLDATKRWEAKINGSFCPYYPFSLDPFLAIQMWIAIVLFVLSFH